MKVVLPFDPGDYDYGPATEAIRSILTTWVAIDWLGPSAVNDETATELFLAHQRLAHAHDPDRFPLELDVSNITGEHAEFIALCERVRGGSWDWKYSVLKQLSHEHARARGWKAEDEARVISHDAPPKPGELFFLVGEPKQLIWQMVLPRPGSGFLPKDLTTEASFYIDYAANDGLDAMKWQLAERSSDLRANPFLALLHCYQAGVYPFSLDRTKVALFRFGAAPLPRAQLLRRR
ncbi:MAG: hypothetical protein SFX73_22820 [Kofleriaceae bacterium]|nr:hypothetical protein [Kofleriaceae bacterium]